MVDLLRVVLAGALREPVAHPNLGPRPGSASPMSLRTSSRVGVDRVQLALQHLLFRHTCVDIHSNSRKDVDTGLDRLSTVRCIWANSGWVESGRDQASEPEADAILRIVLRTSGASLDELREPTTPERAVVRYSRTGSTRQVGAAGRSNSCS